MPVSEGGADQITERALSKHYMVHCPLPAFTSVIQYKSYAKVLNTYERTIKGQSKSLSSPARLGVSTGLCPFLCCKQERKDAA